MQQSEVSYDEINIIDTIGSGTFGTVYKAIVRGHEVAIKEIKKTADMGVLESLVESEIANLM